MRYTSSHLLSAILNPRKVANEVNRYVQNGSNHGTQNCHHEDGIDIFEEEWDNLIVLDACRFDTFQDLTGDLPGELEKRESKAASTTEWLRQNFQDRDLRDTVYVTANPKLHRYESEGKSGDPINADLHRTYGVWVDNWNDDARTVRPEIVTREAFRAATDHPNKRLVIHFIQPHAPYIGPTGKRLNTDYLNFWGSYKQGKFDIDLDTAKLAYRENLELVLPHVEQLLEELQGLSVVTADHGELLGERDWPIPIRQYGHPKYTFLPGLVEVPWHKHQNGERKEIMKGDGRAKSDAENIANETVEARLKDLGYV